MMEGTNSKVNQYMCVQPMEDEANSAMTQQQKGQQCKRAVLQNPVTFRYSSVKRQTRQLIARQEGRVDGQRSLARILV
jgi:hypothetical protein